MTFQEFKNLKIGDVVEMLGKDWILKTDPGYWTEVECPEIEVRVMSIEPFLAGGKKKE